MNTPPKKLLTKRLIKRLIKRLTRREEDRGAALIIVALVLLLLTVLVASAHYTIVSQTAISAGYRNSTQAYYVAEAGIQRTIDWFSHSYTPVAITGADETKYPVKINAGANDITLTNIVSGTSTYPTSSVVTSFENYLGLINSSTSANNFVTVNNVKGQYQITARLLSSRTIITFPATPTKSERWLIDSTGIIINNANNNELARASVTSVIETLLTPAVAHAVCVKDNFDINGNALNGYDSYDSTAGPYSSSNKNGKTAIGSYSTADGAFIPGNGTLDGTIDVPPGVPVGIPARPGICNNATDGCGNNYCPDLAPVPTFVSPTTLIYPTSGTATGEVPPALNSTAGFYKAESCPGGCLTSNNCAPGNLSSYSNYTSIPMGGLPSGSGVGPLIPTINGANTPGSKIGLPANFSGSACIWIKDIDINANILLIDNLTNRIGNGPLNVFINTLSVKGNAAINIVSNKDNPINLYINSSFDIDGRADINNNTTPVVTGATYATQNVQGLYILGAPTASFSLKGGGGSSGNLIGLLYAPNSTFQAKGGIEFFGALIVNSYQDTGTAGGVHYDRQLSKSLVSRYNFVPNTQVRRIF